nr:MFS transporter [Candidatus Njordarchaeota archaeon]
MRLFKDRFPVKDTFTEEEIQVGLRNLIRDGVFSQSMITLTQGAFLVGFALSLGAPNTAIGLLTAIIPLTQLLQIPSIYVVEKYRSRRAITFYASIAGRSMWLFVALIPFIFSPELGLVFLVLAVLLNASIGALGTCSRNSWWRDLVPQDQLGTFFSRRMKLAMIVGIPLVIFAGFYVDFLKGQSSGYQPHGYSVLFVMGFFAGMISIYFISKTPEPRMAPPEGERKLLKMILQPFKDANFKKLVVFLSSWNFAINLAAPFFVVYMLTVIGLGMSAVISLMVLSQLMNIGFLQIWGRFSDRYSNKSVLAVCSPVYLVCIFLWIFTAMYGWYVLTLPLLVIIHIFTGISTAGVTLASQNIGLKLSPKGRATSYLATTGFTNSLAAGFAPILGGVLADLLKGNQLSWTIRLASPGGEVSFPTLVLHQWDFVFVLAVLIGIYSIHRLTMVQEVGEVEHDVIVNELISEVKKGLRNFSGVEGFQRMGQYPYAFLKSSYSMIKKPYRVVKPIAKTIVKTPYEAVKKPITRIFRRKKKSEETQDEAKKLGEHSESLPEKS